MRVRGGGAVRVEAVAPEEALGLLVREILALGDRLRPLLVPLVRG